MWANTQPVPNLQTKTPRMANRVAADVAPLVNSTRKVPSPGRLVNTRHEDVQVPKGVGPEDSVCAAAPVAVSSPHGSTISMQVEDFAKLAESIATAGNSPEARQLAEAQAAALRDAIVTAVNTRASNVRELQETAITRGVVSGLVALARTRSVVAFEALQIVCYRNKLCVQQLVSSGMFNLIESILLEGDMGDLPLQAAAMFLLAALVAFNQDCHSQVIMSKMLQRLVDLCREENSGAAKANTRLGSLQSRASVVLRNLAHSEQCHPQLLASGAAEALAAVMQRETENCNRWMRKLEAQGVSFNDLLKQPDTSLVETGGTDSNSSQASSDEGNNKSTRRFFARSSTMQLGSAGFSSFGSMKDSFKEDRAARQNAWIEELRTSMKHNISSVGRPDSVASTSSSGSTGLYPSIRGGRSSPSNRISGSSFGDVADDHTVHRPDRTSISGSLYVSQYGSLPHVEPPSPAGTASTRFSLSFLAQPINPTARQTPPQPPHPQQHQVFPELRHSAPPPSVRPLNSRSSITSHETLFEKHASFPITKLSPTRQRPVVSPGKKNRPQPPQIVRDDAEVGTKSAMRARFSDVPGVRKVKQVSIALPSVDDKADDASAESHSDKSDDEEGGAMSDTSRPASITSRCFHNRRKKVSPKAPTIAEVKESFARRINATMAVAILVGHEENNPWLQMDEFLTKDILAALDCASRGEMHHGYFWTVWKLCQALSNLTVNDTNKELIIKVGGVEVLSKVLEATHHRTELAQRYAISALWNLAFIREGRKRVQSTPGLVEAIREAMHTTPDTRTRELAKGCLWTLGCIDDVSHAPAAATDSAPTAPAAPAFPSVGGETQRRESFTNGGVADKSAQHIMISYEWGSQAKVLLIKEELENRGYHTWMDVDKMSGSTLEAMALAVEGAAAVLCCVSKKYKESQACRTEAEYAFQMRKKIVPVLMEANYKPTGWLGALLGTKLYFDMSDRRMIPDRTSKLCRELGDCGRIEGGNQAPSSTEAVAASDGTLPPLPKAGGLMVSRVANSVEAWTEKEVLDWLVGCNLGSLVPVFEAQMINGLALNGLHRLADKSCIRKVIRDDLGIKNTRDMLLLVEQLYRLF